MRLYYLKLEEVLRRGSARRPDRPFLLFVSAVLVVTSGCMTLQQASGVESGALGTFGGSAASAKPAPLGSLADEEKTDAADLERDVSFVAERIEIVEYGAVPFRAADFDERLRSQTAHILNEGQHESSAALKDARTVIRLDYVQSFNTVKFVRISARTNLRDGRSIASSESVADVAQWAGLTESLKFIGLFSVVVSALAISMVFGAVVAVSPTNEVFSPGHLDGAKQPLFWAITGGAAVIMMLGAGSALGYRVLPMLGDDPLPAAFERAVKAHGDDVRRVLAESDGPIPEVG